VVVLSLYRCKVGRSIGCECRNNNKTTITVMDGKEGDSLDDDEGDPLEWMDG